MTYRVEFKEQAKEHLANMHKSGNKSLVRKIDSLMEELKEHLYTGTGQPEKLKHNLSGYWSRRINQEHRLVFPLKNKWLP